MPTASTLVCNSLKDFSLPMFLHLGSDFLLGFAFNQTKKTFALTNLLNFSQLHTGFQPPTRNILVKDNFQLLSSVSFLFSSRICTHFFLFPLIMTLVWLFGFLQLASPMYSHLLSFTLAFLQHVLEKQLLFCFLFHFWLSSRYHDFSLSVLTHLMDSH